jgi:bifunctional aspartokinase / homoserine dehydrogenase 1
VPWEVHKFGGASLATAQLYKTVGDLLIAQSTRHADDAEATATTIPTMAIVSAKSGMTDLLVQVVDSALTNVDVAQASLNQAVESQIALLHELVPHSSNNENDTVSSIVSRLRHDATDILSIVQSLRLLHTVPDVTMEVVTGYGEIWSALTLAAYLQSVAQTTTTNTASSSSSSVQKLSLDSMWMDARDILIVKSTSSGLGEKGSSAATTGVTPLWDETARNMHHWWQRHYANDDTGTTADTTSTAAAAAATTTVAPIVVVTGFVASTATGVPTTLKRSGSDYSATIFAKLVHASRVTLWKNTDGVYTADPRAVPEAFSIASLKYDEAAELAYFGAQVLHPSAMVPCIEMNIPVYVRNIFNPAFAGTVISGRCRTLKDAMETQVVKNWRSKSGEIPIKGLTSVDKTALVTLEGASSLGGANVAERFMGAMTNAGIHVMIITQASSEGSITVAVPESQGALALSALQETFALELARSTIGSVSLATGMAIVAIVGEGMALTSGVSATFMSSLSRANVNIRLSTCCVCG